ncbi:MAG: MFS transporter [Burkholderiales bacterium]|nr:MFS transporter [Burkholderiales bacterium]
MSRPVHLPLIAVVAASTAAQIASMMGVTVFPVIAPKLAADLGVEPSFVGYQVSLTYGVATAAAPFMSGMVLRWGASRTMQVGLGCTALAMLLAMSPSLWVFVVVSGLLGLGVGVMAPASAHLLFRYTPERHRNTIFSLKQTGIPLAWVLMAAVAPAIALAFGWRWALALALATALCVAGAIQLRRAQWDDDRRGWAARSPGLAAALRLVWRRPALRWLSVMSFCYTFVQLCTVTFAVTALVEEGGYTLVTAGLVLMLTSAAGVACRLAAGWIADLAGSSRVLAALGVVMMACSVGLGLSSPAPPGWVFCALIVVLGASATAWTGVFFAETARRSPPGQVSLATGGAMAWTYGGVLLGPALFAACYKLVGSYAAAFSLLGAVTAAGLVALRAAAR